MIILDRGPDLSISDLGETLEFFLGSSPGSQLTFVTSAVEIDFVQRILAPINQHGISNNTTVVTILDAPSDTELVRQVKALSIYQPNATPVTITIQLNDNATLRIILTISLELGDTLQYNDGEGFRVIDTNGNIKVIESPAPAQVPKVAQLNPAATTLTALYTVPANTTFEGNVSVANRSTATSFRISIAIAGAGDSNEQYIAYDTPIIANDIYISVPIKLNATDVIRVYATAATLSFTAFGIERI